MENNFNLNIQILHKNCRHFLQILTLVTTSLPNRNEREVKNRWEEVQVLADAWFLCLSKKLCNGITMDKNFNSNITHTKKQFESFLHCVWKELDKSLRKIRMITSMTSFKKLKTRKIFESSTSQNKCEKIIGRTLPCEMFQLTNELKFRLRVHDQFQKREQSEEKIMC